MSLKQWRFNDLRGDIWSKNREVCRFQGCSPILWHLSNLRGLPIPWGWTTHEFCWSFSDHWAKDVCLMRADPMKFATPRGLTNQRGALGQWKIMTLWSMPSMGGSPKLGMLIQILGSPNLRSILRWIQSKLCREQLSQVMPFRQSNLIRGLPIFMRTIIRIWGQQVRWVI